MSVFSSKDFLPDESFPFTIHRYTIDPHEEIPSHTHEFVELVFVQSGNARHVMAGRTYALQAGDVFVIEPSVYHSYEGSKNDTTEVYNVLFHLDFIRNDMNSLHHMSSFVHLFYLAPFLRRNSSFIPYLRLVPTESIQLSSYLDLLVAEVQRRESGFELATKTLLIQTLIFLSRCYEKHRDRNIPMPANDSLMETITRFIHDHHHLPLNIRQISQSFGISQTTLLTKFKQHTGLTVLEYKHQVQIRRACQLLQHTDDKILTVAHAVGFDDLSFFYRVFKRTMGMTPAQYRSHG